MMDSLTAHGYYVSRNRHDRTATLALVDHVAEAENLTYRQALRWVAQLRKSQRDAEEMKAAADVLSRGSPLSRPVEAIIRNAGSEEWRMNATILIVPGSRYPRKCLEREDANPALIWRYVMTIGARRVLAIRDAVLAEWDGVEDLATFGAEYAQEV